MSILAPQSQPASLLPPSTIPAFQNLSDPTILASTAPIVPSSTRPSTSTFSSLVPPSVPTPGYVTIAQLGDSKTTTPSLPAPTKGYITIADLAPSSPDKKSLTDCKEQQSPMSLPQGYSRYTCPLVSCTPSFIHFLFNISSLTVKLTQTKCSFT